ncbi:hypothetical protein EV426DRAFT_289007 [Tirmania nivea]|nr:hypothetical protein EV426DRAFT_289007 [Tirmania nivea]
MSGVEAIGLALGCSTLAFGLVPSILDYRSLPEHCAELQDFISRQSTSLAVMEADFTALMDQQLLSPGTGSMNDEEVESLRNLLQRYRKCLEDFRKMLTIMVKPKPKTTFFDLQRLQMILKGKTGPGLGTLQSRQNFLQLYMIELEATGYRRKLETSRTMHTSFGSRLSRARLGQQASKAYKVSPFYPSTCGPACAGASAMSPAPAPPKVDIVRPSSPADTLVGTVYSKCGNVQLDETIL